MSTQNANQNPPADEEVAEEGELKTNYLDDWYSALASFVFHFCLALLLPLLAAALSQPDHLPPAVEMAYVADDEAAAGEDFSDLAPGSPEMSADDSEAPSEITEVDPIQQVQPTEQPKLDSSTVDPTLNDQLNRASQIAAAARAAAKGRLSDNLGGGGSGGDGGTGGGGGSGRGARAARWVLNFNTASPVDYLRQMGGLGAEVAFPQQGDTYLYFTDLAAARPRSEQRDLASETRIYWMDENPNSYRGVARHLNVPSPPFMVAFLPPELEQDMLRKELARASTTLKRQAREEDIRETVFRAVRRAGGFDIVIVSQKVR